MSVRSRYLRLTGAVGLLLGGIAMYAVPFRAPLPCYLESAREFLAGRGLTDHHSIGYSLFLWLGLLLDPNGLVGVYLLQLALYVGTLLVAYRFLSTRGRSPLTCFIGAAVIAIHPYLLLNVKQISDNTWSTVLLLSIVIAVDSVRTDRAVQSALVAGVVFGVALLFRPNLLSLLPLVFLLPWLEREWRAASALALLGLAAVTALALAGSVNRVFRGRWMVVDPNYSAYTLHNGNNPHSAAAFLGRGRGELSTVEQLPSLGVTLDDRDKGRDARILRTRAYDFIRDHPIDYLRLVAIRAGVFLMPDLRGNPEPSVPASTIRTVVKCLLALPLLVWLAVRGWGWRHRREMDLTTPLALGFYAVPFLLIYADPRYRYPVDILLVLDCVLILTAGIRAAGRVGATGQAQS